MKALVLARGLGTRMQRADPGAALTAAQQRAADAGLKALMPIAGRPFLDYVIGALADAGLTHVGLVVAPQHDALAAHYSAAPPSRVELALVVQREARGTADAVLAAQSWCAGEPFLVMNADNLYPVAALRRLASLDEPGLAAFDAVDLAQTSNIPSERVRAFALVEIDEAGYLSGIVEKPEPSPVPPEGGSYTRSEVPPERGSYTRSEVPSEGGSYTRSEVPPEGGSYTRSEVPPEGGSYTGVSMNLWRFDARIFAACRDVPRSPRGEYELPEAVGLAIRRGVRFRAVRARGPVLDLSRRADAADVERRLAGMEPRP